MPASPDRRLNTASAAYAAIALVFFFGLGLAGGTAYKLLVTNDDSDQQIADQVTPPAPSLPTLAQVAAATPAPSTAAGDAAPSLAHLTPSAPPALTPPPAPTGPAPSIAVAPSMPAAQAAPVAPAPIPYAEVVPATPAPLPDVDTEPPMPTLPRVVAHHHPAPPARKPHAVAKAARPAVPVMAAVALHAPPSAPANVSGPFRVQFGAFANEENARRMQWAVEATGLKVQVTQAPGSNNQMLWYLRSPIFHDYASALSAAETVQDRVTHFVNAIPVDYTIFGDHSALEQQASAR